MKRQLPSRPNLDQLKRQARDLLNAHRAGDEDALRRIRESHPRLSQAAEADVRAARFTLSGAQLVLAREYGFASWPKLKEYVERASPQASDPVEQLKQAMRSDNAGVVRQILDQHPELRAKINEPIGPFDSPAIVNARSPEMLDVLLAAGADLNAKSTWWAGGFGLLHGASAELASYAIGRGAFVDIHAAARLGMLDRVRELITSDPNLVHARGGDGQTPLHFARTVEIAAYLLDHGADMDARDVDHESTPAQYMIDDRPEVARYLIRRGCKTDILMAAALGDIDLVRRHLNADPASIRMRVSEEFFPMISPKAGGTIYQWKLGWYLSAHRVARKFGHDDVYKLLLDQSPDDVKLIEACWLDDEATLQALGAFQPGLARRLLPGDQRQLAHAARNNETGVVRAMLKAGLPVDARGQHNATALHWAAFHGNWEMVNVILPFGPPLEVTDGDFNSTPLGWALHGSEHGWYRRVGDYARTVAALLEAGARLPERIEGTEAVREVLRRHGIKEE
jgi:Ankyrin repeats (3 copies)